jgi:hypothetical protein
MNSNDYNHKSGIVIKRCPYFSIILFIAFLTIPLFLFSVIQHFSFNIYEYYLNDPKPYPVSSKCLFYNFDGPACGNAT